MRRSETIGVWKLVVIVCAAAAVAAATLPTNADQVVIPRGLRSTYEKTSPRIPSPDSVMAVQGESAGVICVQPAANCQERGDNNAGIVSDLFYFAVAEDFRPQAGGSVTQLCWWGAYFDFGEGAECENVPSDRFQVRYYEDAGGVPATAWLASFSVDEGTLRMTGRVLTGGWVVGRAGRAQEYVFTATHAPLPVEAGRCYWIEITNALQANCSWLWEISGQGNGRLLQNGDGINPLDPADRYDHDDLVLDDTAFCLDLGLDDTTPCVLPPPNDDCAGAEEIAGENIFAFDSFSATTTGPPHAACVNEGNDEQLSFDVWYCWTAPCTETAFVRTCDLTDVDTKIAVYDGCSCPPTDSNLLVCNDNLCGELGFPLQSMVMFEAVAGRSYLIRVGTFPGGGESPVCPYPCFPPAPGGTGELHITCGPPDHGACPDNASCCIGTVTPGCSDETWACDDEICCETVCACDPFCCDCYWDEGCATTGFLDSGCGAALLCVESCGECGNASAGDCCVDNGTVACSDEECCDLVCACDPVCCDDQWDDFCAIRNLAEPGCDAATLCPNLCNKPGDLDGDGDVDLYDYGEFIERCFAGPGTTTSDPACGPADFDDNGTVDLKDFAGFQNAFGKP